MTKIKEFTLAIDTCFSPGSFSLWKDETNTASYMVAPEFLLSEGILYIIEKFLSANNLTSANLRQIVYTNGPGGNTSVRVGVATVLGLVKALQIEGFGVAAMDAISTASDNDEDFTCVMLKGKSMCIVQQFNNHSHKNIEIETEMDLVQTKPTDKNDLTQLTLEEFAGLFMDGTFENLICQADFYDEFSKITSISDRMKQRITIASDNASKLSYQYFLNNQKVLQKRSATYIYIEK